MPANDKKPLIIVESPTKARTLTRLLGGEYKVMSSQGHVRDLPVKTLSVDVDHGYEPEFVTIPAKKKILKELKDAAKEAGQVLLATDPDREGEAIAWHLQEEIKRKAVRVEFHEFTRKAVQAALANPHAINQERVNAQMGRRVLDRLVGYKISPVLWRKVRRGLSAGRVQSVAVRLICEREEEIRAFGAQEYWSLEGEFAHGGAAFKAMLVELDAKRISTPTQDQNENTRIITSEAEAQGIKDALSGLAYAIDSVQEKQTTKSPSAPFITATMQQEAFKKLGFNGKRTMRTAQLLYEGIDVGDGPEGLITYMRTDSTRIAPEFLTEARAHIMQAFGKEYLPDAPRYYGSRKSAQEAHEAIRPTNLAYTPERIASRLNPDQLKLYTLIYNRFLASQMANAKFLQRQTDVLSQGSAATARFRRTDTSVVFDGFHRAYREESEEGENGNGAMNGKAPAQLQAGTPLDMLDLAMMQHFTKPPPRYTEASLIKALEENGIGRPSTYAPTIETIIARGYIVREGRALAPTVWAFCVTALLKDFFTEIVDIGFTAKMEEQLDEVEEGKDEWRKLVDALYKPMMADIDRALADKEHDYHPKPKETGEMCPKCGKPLVERYGRFGPFVNCCGYPECDYKKNGEKAGAAKELDEMCPQCGKAKLAARRSRFGIEFVSCSAYPKCKYIREPQEFCPKCKAQGKKGKLEKHQAKNRRIFYSCEHNPGPEAEGKHKGKDACDFIMWARPTVDTCELCGWFIAERKRKETTLRFCCNPACANNKAHEDE